jgi:SAM-dependent methyltransferase
MSLREWDERHRAAPPSLEPDPVLVSAAEHLKPGRALDLACGTGRNALWLAERGWNVTAVDGSRAAIEILQSRSSAIDARVADLERGEYAIEPRAWDLIAIIRYLQRDLFEAAKAGVAPGGLIVATALLGDRGRYRMHPGELRRYFEGWEILHYREADLAELVARR